MANERNITFSKNDLLRKLACFSENEICKFAGDPSNTYASSDLSKKIKEIFINNPNLTNMLGSGMIGGLLGGGLSWLSNLGEKNKKLKKSRLKRNLVYGTALGLGLGTLYNLLSPGQSIFVKGKPFSSSSQSSINPLDIFGFYSSTEEIKGPSLIEKGLKDIIKDPTSVLSGADIGGAIGTYIAVGNYLKNNPGVRFSKLNKPEHIIDAFKTLTSGLDPSKLTENQRTLKTLLEDTNNNLLDNLRKQNIEIRLDNEIKGFNRGDLIDKNALRRILSQDQEAILRFSGGRNTNRILKSLGLPETITISKSKMLPEELVLNYLERRGIKPEQVSEAFSRLRYVPEGKGILSKFYISEPLSFSRFARSYALPVAGLAFAGGLLHKLLFPNKET
jgi:hypothetical protein